jgi:hypothetical protein
LVAVDVLGLLPAALGALEVEARSVFSKLHDGSVLVVHVHGGFNQDVHGDMANFPDSCHGKDVGEQVFVEPHVSKTFHGPHLEQELSATVCVYPEGAAACTYVGEQ